MASFLLYFITISLTAALIVSGLMTFGNFSLSELTLSCKKILRGLMTIIRNIYSSNIVQSSMTRFKMFLDRKLKNENHPSN